MTGVYAVLLCAGSGQRMGAGENKVLLSAGGRTVVFHALKALQESCVFEKVFVVVKDGEQPTIADSLCGLNIPHEFVVGGNTRQESVKNALDALPKDASTVAIHDAARCLTEAEHIKDCVKSALKYGSGVSGKKVVDTVKKVDGDVITGTVDRDSLVMIQTPQVFSAELIKEAYNKAFKDGFFGTDDSMLVERMGITPKVVLSDSINIKLTKPEDLDYAEFLLGRRNSMCIGQGYDAHRFEKGRPLIIGGVNIDYEMGLKGHSDADVLTHAIMDALLGAAGLKDIGSQFPDTDASYKDIYSIELLRRVGKLLKENNVGIVNIDATLLMERPKIAPYRDAMCENIANALNIDKKRVAIKATTTEEMGFIGRKEGAAAQAVCMVNRQI
ncbi:MAG: 2-C-methyl-D-erythritol 2,4-cyclodiphosphate synthase [Christensenellaceae bacterium]|nr:2-C-methyl-D-erythritol 2,4-cyclodiphosphate synthase [Christensenellaceae bacterium]